MANPPASSRDKILDVAEALFARRGFAGVGMREVADTVQLGKSSLFHHFQGKAQLYFEVLGRVLQRIEERVAPILEAPTPPIEKLDRGVDALLDALAEHPTTARLLLRALFEEDAFPGGPLPEEEAARRVLDGLLARMAAVLQEGIESGVFRDVSVAHALQTMIGACVFHFASGELGEELIGGPLLSAGAVRAQKDTVRQLLHHGLAVPTAETGEEAPCRN